MSLPPALQALSLKSWIEDDRVRRWIQASPIEHQSFAAFGSSERVDIMHSIKRDSDKIASLLKELDGVGLRLTQTLVSASAIRALPFEILSQIFLSVSLFEFPKQAKDLLALTTVCKGWRHCILETPALWSYLDLPYQFGRSGKKNIRAAQSEHTLLWICRSKNAPLHLRVSVTDEDLKAVVRKQSLLPPLE
jgi:hypothetical protein